MSEKIPFLDMFPDCASLQDSCGGLDKAEVLDVLIERESMTMLLHTWFAYAHSWRHVAGCLPGCRAY